MKYVPDDVCKTAVETWGKTAQLLMLLEEMSELQKEVLKNMNRGQDNVREIAEETADVLIMLDQLVYIYGIQDLLKEMSTTKLNKLKRYLENDKRTVVGN